jgi:hypothetical protein
MKNELGNVKVKESTLIMKHTKIRIPHTEIKKLYWLLTALRTQQQGLPKINYFRFENTNRKIELWR